MKRGDIEYFCNCLLKNLTEHIVASDKKGRCVYCGHHTIKRVVTDADVRCHIKNEVKLNEIKTEYLGMALKDRYHNEKIN